MVTLALNSLSLLVLVVYAGLLFWYRTGIKRLKTNLFLVQNAENAPKITVVIAMRNEAQNIAQCLNSVLMQTYKNYEVVLVNDHSTDNSLGVVQPFVAQFGGKITVLEAEKTGKKAALLQGIRHATGSLIAVTDADCVVQPEWLGTFAGAYVQQNYKLMSAPVRLVGDENFFKKVQILEFAGLNAIGAACIALEQPNMCNGANLCYERRAFFEVNAFEENQHLASGDDEFLMHKIHERYGSQSVAFLQQAQATVYTATQASLSQFFSQRKRWASKSGSYKNKWITAQMALVFLVNLCILMNILCLNFEVVLWQCALKYVAEWYFYVSFAGFYDLKNWRTNLLLGQALQIPYVVLVAASTLKKGYNWKGRTQW